MFVESFLLGLAYMLAPGPVLVEPVRRSMRGGTRSAAAVQCGAMTANLVYAVLCVCGVGQALVFLGTKFGLVFCFSVGNTTFNTSDRYALGDIPQIDML